MPNIYAERGKVLLARARTAAGRLGLRIRAAIAGLPMDRMRTLKPLRAKPIRPLKPLGLGRSLKSGRPADLPLYVAAGALLVAAIAGLISQHELSSLTQQVAELKASIDRSAAIQAEGPFLAIPEQTWHGKPGAAFLNGETAATPAAEPAAPAATVEAVARPAETAPSALAETPPPKAPTKQAVSEPPPIPAERPKPAVAVVPGVEPHAINATPTMAVEPVLTPKLQSEPPQEAAIATAPPDGLKAIVGTAPPAADSTTAAAGSDGTSKPAAKAEECIPQGTGFTVGANDPYPVCGVTDKVSVAEVQDGRVLLANGTLIPAGGKGVLTGTPCLIELVSAAYGYAQLKVTCK